MRADFRCRDDPPCTAALVAKSLQPGLQGADNVLEFETGFGRRRRQGNQQAREPITESHVAGTVGWKIRCCTAATMFLVTSGRPKSAGIKDLGIPGAGKRDRPDHLPQTGSAPRAWTSTVNAVHEPGKNRIQGANNQRILERHGIGFAKRFRGYGYLAFAKDRRTISCAQLKFFQKPDRCVDDGVTTRNRKTCRRAKALITFRASVKA